MKVKKGITPVIAIVLLLLITIGAVGVVYTQFQNIVGNPSKQLSQQQKVQNTELTFSSVYNNDTDSNSNNDAINITLRNTGDDVTVNVTEQFDIAFSPDGADGSLGFTNYPDKAQDESWCFKPQNGDELLEPGESYTCKTGVSWPGPTDTVGIEVSFKTADKSWSYSCSPSTSGALVC
ncbi:MAG: hypothetical protein ABEJ07_03495 [Candidatus Nanohaloarchaea archaeon]